MRLDINRFLNILKDRFLIGTLVIVIAMLIFFVVGVQAKWSEIDEMRESLKGKEGRLRTIETLGTKNPTPEEIRALETYKKKLDEEYTRSLLYYKRIDEGFEKWFNELKFDPSGTPAEGSFTAIYTSERLKLIELLTSKNIPVVDNNNVALNPNDTEGMYKWLGFEEPRIWTGPLYKKVQKQFWIQKKILEIVTSPEVGVKKCGPIEFTRDLQPVKIPDDLGIMIPFNLTVYLAYKDIPQLIYHLSDNSPSRGGPMMVVQGIKIVRDTKQVKEIETERKRMEEKGKWKPEEFGPLVKVIISGRVLDFDFEKK